MGEKYERGWQGPKAGRGVGSGRLGRKEGGMGSCRWQRGGDGEGVIRTGRGWQWGGGCEEDMERGDNGEARGGGEGRWEGDNGEGKEVGMGKGQRRGQRRGYFTDGYDGTPGWTYAIGLINSCNRIECLGRQRLSHSLIATNTWNAWVE